MEAPPQEPVRLRLLNSRGTATWLTIDENTYDPVADWGQVAGDGMGAFHPLAWYQDYDLDGFGNEATETFSCTAPAGRR